MCVSVCECVSECEYECVCKHTDMQSLAILTQLHINPLTVQLTLISTYVFEVSVHECVFVILHEILDFGLKQL